jgi:hypothetical protein
MSEMPILVGKKFTLLQSVIEQIPVLAGWRNCREYPDGAVADIVPDGVISCFFLN